MTKANGAPKTAHIKIECHTTSPGRLAASPDMHLKNKIKETVTLNNQKIECQAKSPGCFPASPEIHLKIKRIKIKQIHTKNTKQSATLRAPVVSQPP